MTWPRDIHVVLTRFGVKQVCYVPDSGHMDLIRSAHEDPAFLHWVRVGHWRRPLDEVLTFDRSLAARLHVDDRVHTYAGFMIADVAG